MTTQPISPAPTETTVPAPRRVRPPSLARMQRQVDTPTRWTLLALGAWVLWRTRAAGWDGPWAIGLIVYALIALAATAYWLGPAAQRDRSQAAPAVAYLTYVADALFAGLLIWRDGGLGSPLYILLVLLALKAVGLSMVLPAIVWLPFAFGPVYAAALWLAAGSLAFLADPGFFSRYVLLWAWLLGVVLVASELTRRTRQALLLDAALVEQQQALAQKTEILQKTATDLGDRVLELRALQEVAKALATTLRTEETLELVVERLCDVTGSSHCAAALIDRDSPAAIRLGPALTGAVIAGDETARAFRVLLAEEPTAAEAAQHGRPLRVEATPESPVGSLLGGLPYLVTPLISRGAVIGTLYVADTANHGAPPEKLDVSEQLLTSFAYFAATAVENARLYQDAWEKRRELEAVVAGIGDGVVVADTDLSLVLMNPVARDILGLEIEPPGGVPLRPYLSAPAFADLLGETLQSRQEQIRELELAAPHEIATLRTYGALASPVVDASGEVSGVVAVLRDITTQKELERMKSNFLSVVSHELRTPLHSIKGFVEIILMGKTGPVTDIQEDFLKTVRTQTTVLQRMIDDLLEFSRMEAGRVKLALSEVSVAAMAHSVATKLAPLAEEAGLRLGIEMPPDLPEIDADRMRLEQVLTNLVENAIKFTPAGGAITVSAARAGDDRMRLTVADTGIGIPPDEQEKVFDRFYQVDGSERRAYRGTGLGLSICRHIVERHSGRVWVESDGVAGHGARFHVELPIELRPIEAPTIDFTTPARQNVAR